VAPQGPPIHRIDLIPPVNPAFNEKMGGAT
jgi:hypothetical protein